MERNSFVNVGRLVGELKKTGTLLHVQKLERAGISLKGM